MTITSRILGYEITLEKPSRCFLCNTNSEPEILERVVDNDEGVLRYALVLKCRNCHNMFLTTYLIGDVKILKEIEDISKNKPLKCIK